MTVSKLHHFNPQFVLRCFADENGRITTIRQPERRSRTSRVRETGAENHLYSMPGHPHGSDVFEKALGAGIETETALLFERVVKGEWPLPQLDRNTLAEFIALQIIRGPEQRRLMESTASRLVKSAVAHLGMDGMTRWASDTAGQPITDEEAEELLKLVTEDDGVVIPYTARDRIDMMGQVTEPVAGFIAARPWTLVRFTRRSLITSDSPVSLVAYEQPGTWMGVGVSNARFVLYPMTRRIGIIMRDPLENVGSEDDLSGLVAQARSGELDDAIVGTTSIEKMMNEYTAAHAINNIYHHPDDLRFVPAGCREIAR